MNRRDKLSSSPCESGSTEVRVITLGPFLLEMTKRCYMVFDEQIIIAPEEARLRRSLSHQSLASVCMDISSSHPEFPTLSKSKL